MQHEPLFRCFKALVLLYLSRSFVFVKLKSPIETGQFISENKSKYLNETIGGCFQADAAAGSRYTYNVVVYLNLPH